MKLRGYRTCRISTIYDYCKEFGENILAEPVIRPSFYIYVSKIKDIDSFEEYRSYPLIIDEFALSNAWNVQLLEMVNTYNHPIITVKHGEPYMVHDLIYTSFMNWGGDINMGYAPRMHMKAACYIREHIMKADNIFGVMGTNIVSQILSKPEANIYIISPFEFQHDTPGFSVTDASNLKLQFIAADVHKLGGVLNSTTFSVKIEKIEALAKKLSQ